MDQRAFYVELAERWQRAAHQTTNEVLKACYAGKAAEYLERATRHEHGAAVRQTGMKRIC